MRAGRARRPPERGRKVGSLGSVPGVGIDEGQGSPVKHEPAMHSELDEPLRSYPIPSTTNSASPPLHSRAESIGPEHRWRNKFRPTNSPRRGEFIRPTNPSAERTPSDAPHPASPSSHLRNRSQPRIVGANSFAQQRRQLNARPPDAPRCAAPFKYPRPPRTPRSLAPPSGARHRTPRQAGASP